MNTHNPTVTVFRYIAELDAFVVTEHYQRLAETLVWWSGRQRCGLAVSLPRIGGQKVYGLNKRQLHEKLFSEHGVNWAHLPTHLKNGTCVYQVPQIVRESSETSAAVLRTVWTIDREPPVFIQDRAYIERHVFLDRGAVARSDGNRP